MHVEFFGVPRERAGISELELPADTLGQLLGSLNFIATTHTMRVSLPTTSS